MPTRWRTAGDTALHRTSLFRIILMLPALVVAATGTVIARRGRLERNEALARRQKAPKVARQNIQRAERAMKSGDTTAFYGAVWNALAEYFGHRLNLAPGEVTLQAVLAKMPDESGAIAHLFSVTEQRRYGIHSADSDPSEMKSLLKQLVIVLKQCERMKR